jgi:hypothetical protein
MIRELVDWAIGQIVEIVRIAAALRQAPRDYARDRQDGEAAPTRDN